MVVITTRWENGWKNWFFNVEHVKLFGGIKVE